MSRCSTCGGTRVDNILRHLPGCDFYRPADMIREHPDLVDLEADTAFWYPSGEEAM